MARSIPAGSDRRFLGGHRPANTGISVHGRCPATEHPWQVGFAQGPFWQSRYRSVRLLDETALLACAAYVDLNPIRAALAETLEQSNFTSVQRRIEALQDEFAAERVRASASEPERRFALSATGK